MTPKNIHTIFIPPKIFIFLKTPKNIEIQNFEPQKMTGAYICMKLSEYPTPWDNKPNTNKQTEHLNNILLSLGSQCN